MRFGLDVHQPCILRASISEWLVGWIGSRMKLLYGRTHDTFEAWAADKKDDAKQFRRLVNVASSWVDMRHLERLVRGAMVSRCRG